MPAIPDWTTLKHLGSGGTADVSLMQHVQSGITAACKSASDDYESEIPFSALIQREKQLIGKFTFPGFVRTIHDDNTSNEYLLLEFCPGPTLEKIAAPLKEKPFLSVFTAASVAVSFAHANGLIHGDIKPDNFYLPVDFDTLPEGSLFYCKLSDFSLGRDTNEPENARLGAGTVGYMSPELINGSALTFASDIFALGVMGYQLATGTHPFIKENTDPVAINGNVCELTPLSPHKLNQDISIEVSELIMTMISKNLTDRPSSVWCVVEGLVELGSSYPVDRALSPKYFLSSSNNTEKSDSYQIPAEENIQSTLTYVCGDNMPLIRLVLQHNYRAGNIKFTEKLHFESIRPLTVPHAVRNLLYRQWKTLSLSQKKKLCHDAVREKSASHTAYGLNLLEQLLRISTIKRIAFKSLSGETDLGIKAILAQKAGQTKITEQAAFEYGNQLFKESSYQPALGFLKRILFHNRTFSNRTLLMLEGDILKQTGESQKAEDVYLHLIKLYIDKPEDMLLAETYKDLGDLYKVKQQFEQGLTVLKKALDIYTSLENELEVSHTLNNIGNIYWIAGKMKDALQHYRKALRIQRRLNVLNDIASTLSNIAGMYAQSNRHERSARLMRQALELNKQNGNQLEIARCLNNLGFICYLQGANHEAVEHLQESLRLNRKIGSQKEILFNLENLTAIMIRAAKLNEAIPFLKEGIQTAELLDDLHHQAIFQLNMAVIFTNFGNVKQALQHFTSAQKLSDRLEDPILKVHLITEQIKLYYHLDNAQAASLLYEQGLSLAKSITDLGALLNLHLAFFPLSKDDSTANDINAILQEINQQRESTIFKVMTLRQINDQDKLKQNLVSLAAEVADLEEDIDYAGLQLRLAQASQNVQSEQTGDHLARAYTHALQSNLVFTLIDTLISRGNFYYKTQQLEQAYADYQSALSKVKEVIGSIEDQSMVQLFQNSSRVTQLVSGIKSLKQTIHA